MRRYKKNDIAIIRDDITEESKRAVGLHSDVRGLKCRITYYESRKDHGRHDIMCGTYHVEVMDGVDKGHWWWVPETWLMTPCIFGDTR